MFDITREYLVRKEYYASVRHQAQQERLLANRHSSFQKWCLTLKQILKSIGERLFRGGEKLIHTPRPSIQRWGSV